MKRRVSLILVLVVVVASLWVVDARPTIKELVQRRRPHHRTHLPMRRPHNKHSVRTDNVLLEVNTQSDVASASAVTSAAVESADARQTHSSHDRSNQADHHSRHHSNHRSHHNSDDEDRHVRHHVHRHHHSASSHSPHRHHSSSHRTGAETESKHHISGGAGGEAETLIRFQSVEAPESGVTIANPNAKFFDLKTTFSKLAFGLILTSVIIFGCVSGGILQWFCSRARKANAASDYGRAYLPKGDE